MRRPVKKAVVPRRMIFGLGGIGGSGRFFPATARPVTIPRQNRCADSPATFNFASPL